LRTTYRINHQIQIGRGKIHHHIPISKEEDNLAESIKEREKANRKREEKTDEKMFNKDVF
jgi:hypothetical protein